MTAGRHVTNAESEWVFFQDGNTHHSQTSARTVAEAFQDFFFFFQLTGSWRNSQPYLKHALQKYEQQWKVQNSINSWPPYVINSTYKESRVCACTRPCTQMPGQVHSFLGWLGTDPNPSQRTSDVVTDSSHTLQMILKTRYVNDSSSLFRVRYLVIQSHTHFSHSLMITRFPWKPPFESQPFNKISQYHSAPDATTAISLSHLPGTSVWSWSVLPTHIPSLCSCPFSIHASLSLPYTPRKDRSRI